MVPLPLNVRDRLALHEALNPVENFRDVDSLGVADARAVPVGDIGVDSQHCVRPTKEIRTAGVSEARSALPSTGVEREFQELVTVGEVLRDEDTGCVHALLRLGISRRSVATGVRRRVEREQLRQRPRLVEAEGQDSTGTYHGIFNGHCGETRSISTVDFIFKVLEAKAIDGQWRATKLGGTVGQSEAAQFGCVASEGSVSINASLRIPG